MPNHIRNAAGLAALCLVFTSCALFTMEGRGGSGDSVSTTAVGGTTDTPYTAPVRPDAQASADAALAALPAFNFSGSALLVASASEISANTLFPVDGTLGEDQARLNRNAAVEARYGISFIPSTASADDIYTDALAAQNAGLYYADLLLLPANQVGRFSAAGLLRNLRNLPFWQGEEGTGAVYANLGEAVLDHSHLPAVFFNRTLAASLGYDFYAAVEEGRWTWELYLEAAAAAASLDGVSGHALSPTDDVRYDELVTATLASDTPAETLVNLLTRLLQVPPRSAAVAGNDIAALQRFTTGGLLFCVSDLFYMDWIFDAPTEWGILPLPSSDGQTRTPTAVNAPVLCVTANNEKFEMTGLTLAALDAASTDVITDAFVTERLRERLRDWQSAAMLERIADNVVWRLK